MKVKLLADIQIAGTTLAYFKGRTYSATVATNQPKFARLGKNGLKINKVFISKKADNGNSALVEAADFEIVDFPEKDAIEDNYKLSKAPKPPREKRITPIGLELRDGFRLMTDEELADPKLCHCGMGTSEGQCGRPSKFVREFTAAKAARCIKHGTRPVTK